MCSHCFRANSTQNNMEILHPRNGRITVTVVSYLLIHFAAFVTAKAPLLNVTFVAISYTAPIGYSSLVYLGPAMSIGAESIQKSYADTMSITLHFLTDPVRNTCPDLNDVAVGLASEWYYRKRNENDLTIFLNPACVENSELPSFMSQWNALWISTLSSSVRIRDRDTYPTWIAAHRFSQSQLSEFFIRVFHKFQWNNIFILVDTSSPPVYGIVADILTEDLRKERHILTTVRHVAVNFNQTMEMFTPILKYIQNVSRIVLFLGHNTLLREFLITAAKLNMTNGEYVYIAMEGIRNKALGKLHWMYGDKNDPVALQAFQSLLIGHQTNIDDGPDPVLGAEFLRRSFRDYNFTYDLQDQPFASIADGYLAFTMVGTVLSELLTQKGRFDPRDGRALAQRFLNRTFTDTYGTFYIAGNGQRRTDFVVSYFSSAGLRAPLLTTTGDNTSWVNVAHISTWGNSSALFPPFNEPLCGYSHQNARCQPQAVPANAHVTLAAACTALAVFLISATAASYARYVKRTKAQKQSLFDPWWQLTLTTQMESFSRALCAALSSSVGASRPHGYGLPTGGPNDEGQGKLAAINGESVICHTFCKSITSVSFEDLSVNRRLLVLLQKLKMSNHQNLCRFYGLDMDCQDGESFIISTVFECPARGNLPGLYNSFVLKDFIFTSSMITDFLQGLEFVHCSSFGYHGRLSIFNCWIDKRFTLKLTHLATDRICSEVQTVVSKCNAQCTWPTSAKWESFFWMPPVAGNRTEENATKTVSMQAIDIYSSGFIVYDILTRGGLWKRMETAPVSVVGGNNPLRHATDVSSVCSQLVPILQTCWDSEPTARPTVKQLRRHLAATCPLLASQTNLLDKIQEALSAYSVQLEQEVEARSAALWAERLRCDVIISQILPKDVVTKLRVGLQLEAELFECATLSFTELHGFTDVVNTQMPATTIALIAKTEEYVDMLISQCDVYKVEAIGDSFLAASGLPQRIGGEHIRRMATFALKLQNHESMLSMPVGIRIRIGIHSGPCAAGVMGTKRLRYCLFGDTVNVASRMCTYGLPGRIHLSAYAKELLGQFDGFHVQTRGLLLVKGKHNMLTYWLTIDNNHNQ